MPALIKLASVFKLGTLFGGGKSLKADDYEAAFNNLVWMILDVADKTLDITPLHKEDASKSQEGGKGGGFLSSLLS